MLTSEDPRLAGRVAFTYPNFVSYTLARFFVVVSLEMQSVAVAWQVYEITRRPLDLGYVGLAQFLPGLALFLVAGHAADLFDRQKLLMWCYGGFALCSALLLAISWHAPRSVHSIYGALVLLGIFLCFNWPASRALLPQLVPEEHFSNAVAWNASTFQIAKISGPAIGGIAYALFRGPQAVYAIALLVSIVSTVLTLRIKPQPAFQSADKEPVNLRTVLAGFRFIWEKKVILGSISLDMFAVLLGGAVALLPVYAKEVLHTGPWGLGVLRSAPRGRGRPDGDRRGALSHSPSRRLDDAIVCRRVRHLDHHLRNLAQPYPVTGFFIADRRDRHGERDHPRHSSAGCNSRRDAWARECRRYALYWSVERVGRV